MVFNPIFTDYLDTLTSEIISKNPELKSKNLKFFISRHNSPNALSTGNGVIIINMGLFKHLENEAQLASVIAHEIAHQKLNHTENSIIYNAKLNTSKEKKRQAKEIRRQKYNQYDKAFDILKNLMYTNSKKHRKHESEADSLGYELFKKTKYPKTEFVKALDIMAELDSLPTIKLSEAIYKQVFNLPKQPFKQEWMKKEDFGGYNYNHYKDKIDKDSIESHPEMVERILKLKKAFPKSSETSNIIIDNLEFKKLQRIARKEDVANLNYLEKYGLSVYLALHRLQKEPNDNYYNSWIGKNFKALYNAKKKYQFNRYVDRLIPKEQDGNYQQFLSFLWNLNLNEMKNIADHYTNKEK